jgi:hypothetical protein
MPKKTLKVKGGSKKKGGGKKKKGRSKSPKKKAPKDVVRDAALGLTGNEILELQILREDRVSLQARVNELGDSKTVIKAQMDEMIEEEEAIFENLRSKVEKSKAYAKVLLDQRDIIERERQDAETAMQQRLQGQQRIAKDAKAKLEKVLSEWNEEKKKIELAGKALAERKSMHEKIKSLETDLEQANSHVAKREEEHGIITSIDKVKQEGYGVPALLLETLKCYPERRIIVRDAIAALTRVLHPTNADFVYEKGGVDCILNGLHDHMEDAQIQANGCRFLWQILIQGDTAPILAKLEERECLMFVLDAMQRHSDERHLHYNAVGLACLLVPKLRMQIESNHNNIAKDLAKMSKHNEKTTSGGRASTGSLPSLTGKSSGKTMINNLTKNSGMGMLALKKMTKKSAAVDLPSAEVLRSRQTTSDTVRMLFAAMDYRDGDGLAAQWCCTVLSSIIFKRAEQEVGHTLPGPSELPSLVRKHALDTIKRSVDDGERGFVSQMVHLLKSYRGKRHDVMQGMVGLMLVQLLPDDPVKKTKYLKVYKQYQVPQAVTEVAKQEHVHKDKDLLSILSEILTYFAYPIPEDPSKKKKFGMLFSR